MQICDEKSQTLFEYRFPIPIFLRGSPHRPSRNHRNGEIVQWKLGIKYKAKVKDGNQTHHTYSVNWFDYPTAAAPFHNIEPEVQDYAPY